jgi:polyhydroxyalkanoate synthesis regulator phasin
MSTDRLQKAKDRLNAYYEAELAILAGQEYRIGTRTLRRADLKEIRSAINELEKLVQRLEAQASGDTTARTRRVVIRDI